MHRVRSAVAVLLFLALFSAVVWAQTETGQISGTVTDPTGALVPNAKVTATAVATGAVRTAQTNQSGVFTIPNVAPGTYNVVVEATGFSSKQVRAEVAVGARVGLEVALEVGQASTIVEVSGTAGQINTETQTVSQVINTRQILELPSLTRNPYDFVLTAGNVSENDPSTGRGVGVAINGQRSTSTGILLDGAQNTDDFGAAVGINVPLDSVQEYSVLTNNYTAEYGRAAGGIVNVLTKSGTNEYHGTAYWFNRVNALATNTFDNNANGIKSSPFTRNQFGYSLGGPIIKNKLFFFNNTEWIRIRSSAFTTAWIPTQNLIGLAAPNTQNFFKELGTLRKDLVNLETLTKDQLVDRGFNPCAGSKGGCNAIAGNTPMFTRVGYNHPADAGGGSPENAYMTVAKADYNVSEKLQLYGRYALEHNDIFPGYQIYNSPYEGFDSGRNFRNHNALFNVVGSIRPNIVSQSKLLFSRLEDISPMGDRPASPTLYMRTTRTSFLGANVAMPGYLPYNPGVAIPAGGPQNTLAYYQDLSVIKGAHQLRMGGNYLYIQQNRTFGAYMNSVQTLGANAGTAIDNFLKGELRQFQGAIDPQGKFPCKDRSKPDATCLVNLPVGSPSFARSNLYNEFALYLQDTWKVARGLTLNLGVRYEYFGVQHNRNRNLDSNYYDAAAGNIFEAIRNGAAATTPNSPIKGLWRPDYNNFGPRFGVAWDPTGSGRTSIRGGYGISYDRNFGNVTFNVIQNPPNYAVLALNSGVEVPVLYVSTSNAGPLAGSSGRVALPPVSMRNVDSNMGTAYAHQWSGSVEHQFNEKIMGAIEYVGSKGVGLYSIEDPNKIGYGNAFLGDPCTPDEGGGPGNCTARLRTTQYTALNRRGAKGFSTYNGANFRLNIQALAGLSLRTNYTWSHAIDNLSSTFSESDNSYNLGLLDPFHPELDKGDADFDVRHRIAISGIWDIPVARKATGWMKYTVGGWQLAPIFTARTGNAFTIFDTTNAYFNGAFARAMFNGAVPRKPSGTPQSIGTNAFAWMDLSGAPVDSSWYNPIVGTSEVGPFPSNMSGRNAFRGPGSWNMNLGLYKNTAVSEKMTVQLRGEFYNFFNHSNLWVAGSDADMAGENRIITAQRGVPPSFIGVNERRNVQLALKLIF